MQKKDKIEDLAALGGAPAFSQFIPVGRPNLGDKEEFLRLVDQIWESKLLANQGPLVQEFERVLAEYIGAKHVMAVVNGTVALELAAKALGLKGEVIVPSFTFIASAHCLQWQEISPVFCDIDPATHTIDTKKIEELITPRTTGILAVHLWGVVNNVEELEAIAKKHNLKLFFDAAHAFGCSYKGKKVGNFGDCEVYSFHATKFFNSFEGGAIATNDDELARKIKLMRNFGFVGYDNVQYIGTNGKMVEIVAAGGLVNFKKLSYFVQLNKANYEEYRNGLSGIPGIKVFAYDSPDCEYNYQYVVLEVDEEKFGMKRDQLVCLLTAENLSARRYFYPGCHNMEPYRSINDPKNVEHLLPETVSLCSKVICVPNGTSITPEQIRLACDVIRFAQSHANELKDRVPFDIEPKHLQTSQPRK
eukprot:TRINITY_DN874_c0_g1_i1.p1 TRINITY_DN874_c0_g1~~TRINITY_DN874_c0_g1_i1.p1  ORF type:complete len:418 (+),score=112.03 TRINITY_DN874_c0_g1_i1:238-1491(+)